MKTFNDRAEEYFNKLTKPLADEKGLIITSYVVGCIDQEKIMKDEFLNVNDQFIHFTDTENKPSKMNTFTFLVQILSWLTEYIKDNNYHFIEGSGWESDLDIEVFITTNDLVIKFLDYKQIYKTSKDLT